MEPFSTGSSTYISLPQLATTRAGDVKCFRAQARSHPTARARFDCCCARAVEMRATTASSTPFGSPRGQLGFDSPRKAASTLTSPRGGLADSFMSTASRYSQSPLCPKHCGRCDYCGNIPYEGALPYRPLESTAAWKICVPSPTTSSPRPPNVVAMACQQSRRHRPLLRHAQISTCTSQAIPYLMGNSQWPRWWHQTPLCPLPY